MFLIKGSRTASIQEGLDCLALYHSGFEGKRRLLLLEQQEQLKIKRDHWTMVTFGKTGETGGKLPIGQRSLFPFPWESP